MCGIAGVVDARAIDSRPSVERQLRHLDHRGPDSWGVYTGQGAVIGQTRLAVIDLVTGDPPVTGEDGAVGVALNGEIYNFQSLRSDLRARGHKLTTEGDTETIAHLAEDLEPAEVARSLDGMFAFAVWDDRRRRLVLGRDRLGKKPLYYWHDGGRLVFASEIKAVLAHPLVSRDLDPGAIPAYLTFGYVPTPRTFFAGINSVPPGHVLTLDAEGLALERYWEPRIAGLSDVTPLDIGPPDAARAIRGHLDAAVRKRLVADVPLGAFLSGGVDSSAIVAIMAEHSSRPVLTFTIGFEDDEGFDERPYARGVAQRFATEHVEFVVKPDAVDLMDRLLWHHDQPFGDSSAIPTFLLSELTRRHVTVALCGDGGDELFAGYERFAAAMWLDRYRHVPVPVRRGLAAAVSRLPADGMRGRVKSLHRFMARSERDVPDAFLTWVSYIPEEWRQQLLGSSSSWGVDDYHGKWAETQGGRLLDRLLQLTLRTYLLDDLLPKVDRMAMAHALEVRSPFLDHELVEFALRLPDTARVKGMKGKQALKLALGDVLPGS
ncbi:MAG: asparagine synthase (glutamine-hydrolyzing), partial [Actinomycetota bacterium]|nr:asparagine synthase (glutamine-hydrolyzing) [Actinomycetota bacterium]